MVEKSSGPSWTDLEVRMYRIQEEDNTNWRWYLSIEGGYEKNACWGFHCLDSAEQAFKIAKKLVDSDYKYAPGTEVYIEDTWEGPLDERIETWIKETEE
ncbi:MAG: hypothetical protein WC476_01625 [Phycisphaerae bacterium]|jgi:hypothetical protein